MDRCRFLRLLPPLLAGLPLVTQGTQDYVAKVPLLEKITAYVDWPATPADHPFGLAVQWHPEWLVDIESELAIFKAFVDAAAGRLNFKNGS